MNTDLTNIDLNYLSHQEFVAAYEGNKIDFKIVGYQHDKLLFGSERTIQKVFNILQYLPLVIIPILAYFMANWWLLVGLLIYTVTAGFSFSAQCT